MAITVQSLENFEEILKNRENATEGRLLSRKRRYLIFPEGSSLQLGKLISIIKLSHQFISKSLL